MKFPLTEFNSNAIVTAEIKLRDNNLILRYSLESIEQIVWPAYLRTERKDELWKSTCFELFLGSREDESYREINLSPSGAWNSYVFSGYRQEMKTDADLSLVELDSNQPGILSASIQLNDIPPDLLLGPAAILKDGEGELTYFATAHGERPDFHNKQHHVLVSLDHL